MFSTKLDVYFIRHFFSFFANSIIVNAITRILNIVINVEYFELLLLVFSFVTIAIGVLVFSIGFCRSEERRVGKECYS